MDIFIEKIINSSDFDNVSSGTEDIIIRIFNDIPKPLIPTMELHIDNNIVWIKYGSNTIIRLTKSIDIISREVRLRNLLD